MMSKKKNINMVKNRLQFNKLAIIREIKTPLGLLVLIVLVTEGILGVVATKASGLDFTLLLIGMFVILFLITIFAYLIIRQSNKPIITDGFNDNENITELRFDAFISSPMAAFENDELYKQDRKRILKLTEFRGRIQGTAEFRIQGTQY